MGGITAQLLALLTGRSLRPPEAQRRTDAATRRLSLYEFRGCPYCLKVRWAIRRLQLHIELRDATNDMSHRLALIEQGGRFQAPCLRIEQEDGGTRWLYESSDIIRYLEKHFSAA